jgi:hypothetical protein
MSLAVAVVCIPDTRSTALEESIMTATYTFDVFSSLDGFGAASGNWTEEPAGHGRVDHAGRISRLAGCDPRER